MTTNENPPSATIHQNLIRKRDVARELNICERTVDNLKRANKIAFVQIGRSVRFELSAVEEFKNSRRIEAV